MGLREVLDGIIHAPTAEATFRHNQNCPMDTQDDIWHRYLQYRKSGYVKPFHTRRSPYRIKMYHMGSHIIKEYSGARGKVEREIKILEQLQHDGLTSHRFIVDQGSRISLVMDWAGEGLREHRTRTHPHDYSEPVVRHMAHQLASSLAYLHARGIIHRDIKPDNIGVQIDHSLHLFDWGEAMTLSDRESMGDRELLNEVGCAGTPLFMAPEALNYLLLRGKARPGAEGLRAVLTTKLDVWGLGCVVYFLLAGRDLFTSDANWELDNLADIAGASTGVELPEGVAASEAARDFLRCCLERDPERRAAAKQLLQHPWLRGATTMDEVRAARVADSQAQGAQQQAALARDQHPRQQQQQQLQGSKGEEAARVSIVADGSVDLDSEEFDATPRRMHSRQQQQRGGGKGAAALHGPGKDQVLRVRSHSIGDDGASSSSGNFALGRSARSSDSSSPQEQERQSSTASSLEELVCEIRLTSNASAASLLALAAQQQQQQQQQQHEPQAAAPQAQWR